MPRKTIPDEVWAAIRAAYEVGASIKGLAKQFDLDPASIRYRRDREGWQLDKGAIDRAHDLGTAGTLRGLSPQGGGKGEGNPQTPGLPGAGPDSTGGADGSPPGQPPGSPPPFPPIPPGTPTPAHIARHAKAELTERIKQQLVEEQADLIMRSNLEAIERLTPLKQTQAQLAGLLTLVTRVPRTPEEEEAWKQATSIILLGETGSLSSTVNAVVKLTESIQSQERRALGAEDRAKRLEVSGPNGQPLAAGAGAPAPQDLPDFEALPIEDLSKLLEAGRILDGRRARPPIPMPPGEPPDAA